MAQGAGESDVEGPEGYAFGGAISSEVSRNVCFYSVLNVSKNASGEKIRSAYRQLCVQYHPDKHATLDDRGKQAAQAIFQKIKRAYEVLSDPQKRAIYDVYGEEGLEADWDVMPRFQTPAELLEMHERLQRMKEDERLQQMTRPRGHAMLSLNGRSLFARWPDNAAEEEEGEDELLAREALEGGVLKRLRVSQSIEVPLTVNDTLEYACHMDSTADGRGEGSVIASLRHSFSSSCWVAGACQVGSVGAFSLKGFRQLPSACFVFSHLTMQYTNGMIVVPAPSVLVGRQMSVRTVAELEWGDGLAGEGEEGLTTRLVHSTDRGRVSASCTLGPYRSFATLQFKPLISSRSNALVEVKAGTFGMELAYGVDHAVTKFTRIGLRIQTSFPGGISLSLRYAFSSSDILSFHVGFF